MNPIIPDSFYTWTADQKNQYVWSLTPEQTAEFLVALQQNSVPIDKK